MGTFVKTGAFGGYKIVSGGLSDPECTHVILTKQEYERLVSERDQARFEAGNERDQAQNKIALMKNEAEYKIRQVLDSTETQVADLQTELESEKEKVLYQKKLNENLLRIAKERANADRKLRPKKERTGYVIVNSEEKEYRYKDGGHSRRVFIWETIIQSPYSVDFSEDIVRVQIPNELFPKEGTGLVRNIGITGKYGGDCRMLMLEKSKNPQNEFYRRNIILAVQQRFKRNFRSGYWEIVIAHTKPLGTIPDDMKF